MTRFIPQPPGMTVRELVALTGAAVRTDAPLDHVISGIAPLDRARPADIVFFDNQKYLDQLASTHAGACLLSERFEAIPPRGVIALSVAEPFRAFVKVARALFPDLLRPTSMFDGHPRAPGAIVHESAQVEDGVTIDPGAVIGPGAGIGSGTIIGANAVIGPHVQIGRDCSVGPAASVLHALIGDHVIIHAGCRIGHDGFRYHNSAQGHIKVPQVGRVIIQDHVEIGAGTAIDRGGGADTVIGEGSKIDNLVQIGHNVTIGRHCIIVAQCGLSGGVTLGDHVILAGQVGVADHVTIGERAVVAAKSGVMDEIPPGEKWMGYPARPYRQFFRMMTEARKRD